jgi:toxin FitB
LENKLSVSAVSMVEVLGYHKLQPRENTALDIIFSGLTVSYPAPEVFQTAIELRPQSGMSLGDALIAATAIYHNFSLATHNTEDFEWIDSLQLLDPLQA